MDSKTPLVSVVMASYNHAKFVNEAIMSILKQTYQNFEVIITDDGSSDNSCEVIRAISDPRIKFFAFEENRGACAALNNSIADAQGEYIAVMNSDDVWVPQKLEKQVHVLWKDPSIDAVFSNAILFKEGNGKFEPSECWDWLSSFNTDNRSPAGWLRYFFFNGNCLCHPSILIKRSCYDVLGLYDNRYRQLPDFEMWVRFCKKFKLSILQEKLVKFRVLNGWQNASSGTTENQVRLGNEAYLIMRRFFDGVSMEMFREGFEDLLTDKEFTSSQEFEIEKALLYLKTPHSIIGLERLHDLLANPKYQAACQKYDLNDNALQTMNALYNRKAEFIPRLRGPREDEVIEDAVSELKQALYCIWYSSKKTLLSILFRYMCRRVRAIVSRVKNGC